MFSLKNFKLKYSFIISEEVKVEAIAINNKILVFATIKGEIFIKNLFTYETYQVINKYENFP